MTASAEPPPWVDWLRARRWYAWPWHWVPLVAWAAVWFRAYSRGGAQSWPLFVAAARLLSGGHPASFHLAGGLHLYASYPRFQFGPVTVVAAAVLRLAGSGEGVAAAQVVMTGCGLAVLAVAARVALLVRPDVGPERIRWTVLGAGVVFLPAWEILAVSFMHLDDVLALLFAVLALRSLCAGSRAAGLTGVLLALSGCAKPWAYAFLALLLALPAGPAAGGGWRRDPRVRGAAWAAAVTVLLWAPFLLADPGTVSAARYAIPNVADSGLRALGVNAASTPAWDRPAQLLIGLGLAALAVGRGRWPAVLLIVTSVRIGLDPNNFPYYGAGLVTGTLVWDLCGARRPAPAWTLAAAAMFWGWNAANGAHQPTLAGWMRVAFAVAAASYTILAPAALLPNGPMAPSSPS